MWPKVGDKVRATRDYDGKNNLTKGNLYEVVRVYNTCTYVISDSGAVDGWVTDCTFEPVEIFATPEQPSPIATTCTCDFRGASCWLGCRCGAIKKTA